MVLESRCCVVRSQVVTSQLPALLLLKTSSAQVGADARNGRGRDAGRSHWLVSPYRARWPHAVDSAADRRNPRPNDCGTRYRRKRSTVPSRHRSGRTNSGAPAQRLPRQPMQLRRQERRNRPGRTALFRCPARRHAAGSQPKRSGRPRTVHSIRVLVLRLTQEGITLHAEHSADSSPLGGRPRRLPAPRREQPWTQYPQPMHQ